MLINSYKMFAYNATLSDIGDVTLYNKSYRLKATPTEKQLIEKGLLYLSRSNSLLLNAFLYRLEVAASYYSNYSLDSNIRRLDFNVNYSYSKGAIVIVDRQFAMIDENKKPKLLKDFLGDKYVNKIPDKPQWSIGTLTNYCFDGNGEVQVIQDSSNLVNIEHIVVNQDKMMKDYLSDPDVGAHKNDDFHIHVYGSEFFGRTDEDIGAFNFNFPKKLIFCFQTPSVIRKNIFKCFPQRASIRLIGDDPTEYAQMKTAIELSAFFESRLYEGREWVLFVKNCLEITQIKDDFYIIEKISQPDETFGGCSYIDIRSIKQNESLKTIAYNISHASQTPKVVSTEINNSATTEKIRELFAPLRRMSNIPLYMRLPLYGETFFFFIKDSSHLCVVRFDSILKSLTLVNDNLEIPIAMASNILPKDAFVLHKNYGQFPENQHLITRIDKNNNKLCCFLTQTSKDTFEIGPVLPQSDDAYRFSARCQYYDPAKKELHMLEILLQRIDIRVVFGYSENYKGISANPRVSIEEKIFNTSSQSFTSERIVSSVPQLYGNAQNNVFSFPTAHQEFFINNHLIIVGNRYVRILCQSYRIFFSFKIENENLTIENLTSWSPILSYESAAAIMAMDSQIKSIVHALYISSMEVNETFSSHEFVSKLVCNGNFLNPTNQTLSVNIRTFLKTGENLTEIGPYLLLDSNYIKIPQGLS
jgi:hypothetical protein